MATYNFVTNLDFDEVFLYVLSSQVAKNMNGESTCLLERLRLVAFTFIRFTKFEESTKYSKKDQRKGVAKEV